ncbi:DNA repair protein RecO [Thalassotalea fusca]
MIATLQRAFILHTRPYQEHKLLVDCFTREQGRVAAVAYLPKSLKSDKKGLLQPFYPLKMSFTGHSNLKTIKQLESASKSIKLSGNALYSGFYLNELLVRLLPEQMPCEEFFMVYSETLKHLARGESIEPALRLFENALLSELGMSLDFSEIFAQQEQDWVYLAEQGFFPASAYPHLPSFKSDHLMAIANQQLIDKQVLSCYKVLMRQIFSGLLGDKPLNSRALFKRE